MDPARDLGMGDYALHRYLDGEHWPLKNELRGLLGGCPLFQPRYDLSLDEMRALTFERVKFSMGLPLVKRTLQGQAEKTKNFVSRSLVLGEVLSTADMATGVKEQKYTGMFAITERGCGSNVRGIQTEATFDLSAQEFVIHTPCEDAQKMYIGNAMLRNYATVFAQLTVGGRSQGPHCFIVPVRDESGSLYPGVTVIDMMYKEGRNGVDNGILILDKVRIPRDNLLDGQYHSPIKNNSARFNVMLAALTPSRLLVMLQALGAMKLGLTIAICYSHSRRQLGPKAQEEVRIIEHQTQTLRLMPHLATTLALTFTSRYAGVLLDEDVFQGKELVARHPLQALVAGLKAYSTWESIRCLRDGRECTGGMSYMMENRIAGLKCDTDVFVTFESDNVVMLQVVARELLGQHTKQYEERPLVSLLRSWAESGSDKLRTSFLALNMDTVGNLAFLLKAVNFRERVLQRGLVARIYYKVVTKKEDFFKAWSSCLHHVSSLSLAHIHRVTLTQFSLAVRRCPDRGDQALLMKFCPLYGTKLVFQERAWNLEHKYLTPEASTRIRSKLLDLCDSVKDDALRVISAFNIPHTSLHAPIAGITNPLAAWAFYPAPRQPGVREGERSSGPSQEASYSGRDGRVVARPQLSPSRFSDAGSWSGGWAGARVLVIRGSHRGWRGARRAVGKAVRAMLRPLPVTRQRAPPRRLRRDPLHRVGSLRARPKARCYPRSPTGSGDSDSL